MVRLIVLEVLACTAMPPKDDKPASWRLNVRIKKKVGEDLIDSDVVMYSAVALGKGKHIVEVQTWANKAGYVSDKVTRKVAIADVEAMLP